MLKTPAGRGKRNVAVKSGFHGRTGSLVSLVLKGL